MGNWKSETVNGTVTSRTNNAQNQATTIGSATLDYDANGNTTTDQSGDTYIYDGWNRLVEVKSGTTVIASYSYDALGRRITETQGSSTTDFYYSQWGQVIQSNTGSTVTQYVWSPFYVNGLVEQDSGSTRLYAETDADYNVTSLTNSSGAVVAQFTYDPYGAQTVLSGSLTTSVGFQGGMLDSATGQYHFDFRDYSPATAQWLKQDPAGYIDGLNRYQFEGLDSPDRVDPLGLASAVVYPTGFTQQYNKIAMAGLGGAVYWAGNARNYPIAYIASGALAFAKNALDNEQNTDILATCAYPLPGRRVLPPPGPINPQNGDPLVASAQQPGKPDVQASPQPNPGISPIVSPILVMVDDGGLYRSGKLPDPTTGTKGTYLKGSQGTWATEPSTSNPNYANDYGLPAENSGKPDWIAGGRANSDAGAIGFGPADPIPPNMGGADEITISPSDVTIEWFIMTD